MSGFLRPHGSAAHQASLSFAVSQSLLMDKAMATHSSTLAWKIPQTEEPGRLQSMESLRVRHNWATSLSLFTFMHWRRKWQPTPVFLPGESQGRWGLVGCHLWGRTESDTNKSDWSNLAAAAAEFAQTYVHWVSDVFQLSHPLSAPSPPVFSLSQHQGLFQWVGSSHQVDKVEFHPQLFQRIRMVAFL